MRALALEGWRLVPALARAARSFVEREGWRAFGYVRLSDFAREQLQRSGRWARDLADLGVGLDRFPELERALTGDDGERPLGRVAALCIARTGSESTLADWLRLGRRLTVRELVQVARQARRAGTDQPTTPPRPDGEVVFHDAGVIESSTRVGTTFEPTGGVEDDDDAVALQEVCLALPEPVDVAIDEALRLHRAVSGGEATLVSFAEALVGETCAGPHPPDTECVTLQPGPGRQAREEALERANDRWRHLQEQGLEPLDASDAETLANLEDRVTLVLDRVAELEGRAGEGDPATVAIQLWELVQLEHSVERFVGRLLYTMGQRGDWAQLGFSGVGHYAEERLAMHRRVAESRAGIVGVLQSRPEVRRAYEGNALGLEAAWILARALGRGPVDARIERAWVKRAREVSQRRLRDEVRRVRLARYIAFNDDGAGPEPSLSQGRPEPAEIDALPTSVFEARMHQRLPWRQRVVSLPPSDREWLTSLERWPGMTRERVWRLGYGALREPSAVVFRRFRLPEDLAGTFLSTIESERRRLESMPTDQVLEREAETLAPPSLLAAREYAKRLRRVPAWVGLLAMLEDFTATWDDPRSTPARPWQETYEAADYRCMAPGCTVRARIQDHHLQYRSDGGGDEPWNQLALCSAHHLQGEHGEFAQVRGTAPFDITWKLGVGVFASSWKNDRRLDASQAASPGQLGRQAQHFQASTSGMPSPCHADPEGAQSRGRHPEGAHSEDDAMKSPHAGSPTNNRSRGEARDDR